ncbi:MAG: glycosyltransferase [Candidatus Sedimenticola sp. 20ELBAFRAG]
MKAVQILLLFSGLLAILVLLNIQENSAILGISVYGAIAITYILFKLLASTWYKPFTGEAPAGLSVAAVVPVHNEEPELFRASLESILTQTREVQEIWVVDDGSEYTDCYEIARERLKNHPAAHVIRFTRNRGKRHAQAEAFRQSTADIFLTCDSDTVLDRDAVAKGLKAFSDPAIKVVTANIRALNRNDNILTRLIDLRYQNAFQHERSAYSVFGSVLCATGVLSFYRAEVIRKNLHRYLNQRFLGVEVKAGDDRRLTNYCLGQGKSVIQLSSKAQTAVPKTIGKFLQQQIRWNQSFFRESLYVLSHFSSKKVAWWLTLSEMGLWLIFGLLILVALVIAPLAGGKLLSIYYLSYISLMAYIRNIQTIREQKWVFLLTPVYALVHIILLIPLRFYSLATIRNNSWRTRSTTFLDNA